MTVEDNTKQYTLHTRVSFVLKIFCALFTQGARVSAMISMPCAPVLTVHISEPNCRGDGGRRGGGGDGHTHALFIAAAAP